MAERSRFSQRYPYPKSAALVGATVTALPAPSWGAARAPLTLRLDPARASARRSTTVNVAGIIDDPAHPKCSKRWWNTPRYGKTDGCKTLTTRSERDLPTTVYFERGTPYCADGVLNPDWVDWLQGFPPGYTDPTQPLHAPVTHPPLEALRTLDLFSGIGGIARGLAPWCNSVAFCDWDPHARAVLQARMDDGQLERAPIFDDVRTLDAERLRAQGVVDVDCVAGGFPCVGISQAGHKEGLEEAQSGLFWALMRLVDEVGARYVFLENVANITAPSMRDTLAAVHAALAERGFDARYVTVRAPEVGAPQTRHRWFLLGVKRGAPWPRAGADARAARAAFWDVEPCPRQVARQDLDTETNRARVERLKRLGNTVIPQMVTAAFAHLAEPPDGPPSSARASEVRSA